MALHWIGEEFAELLRVDIRSVEYDFLQVCAGATVVVVLCEHRDGGSGSDQSEFPF